jgi:hypothetical protein
MNELGRWARDPRRADLPEAPGAMLGRLADDSVDVAV